MDNKKGKTALIVIAIVLVLGFAGVSAFRYFTVVAPNQAATEEQAQEGEMQEEKAENQDEGAGESEAESAASANKTNQDTVSYEGEAAKLFSILYNFNWIDVNGEYIEFNPDGTMSKGAQRADFTMSEFTIRAVDGTVDAAGGCQAVVSSGEQYYIMSFAQNSEANAALFADAPDSDYRIDCRLFGDKPFFKVMTDGVTVDGYEFGAPDEVLTHQKEIDAKIAELVASELPAVSKVTWTREATVSYSEEGKTILLMYSCNNPSSTLVTVTYTPSTGDTQIFAGNNENAFTESQIAADEGSDSPEVTSGQASPEELAQAAEREAAQASDEGGNQ